MEGACLIMKRVPMLILATLLVAFAIDKDYSDPDALSRLIAEV